MRIHKEGYSLLIVLTGFLVILNAGLYFFVESSWVSGLIGVFSLALWGVVLQFFRNPIRTIDVLDNGLVYAPADGKVVVMEEKIESEFFNDRRLQVSIFMSPFNVHVNRNPISGVVKYFRYHEGKYLVAWHPKASTENERTTVVIDSGKHQILFRQIAGALAKRIEAYVKEGQKVTQGADMGFIKFGSRVDIFLPLDAEILVKIDEKVTGNKTILARLK
jgi:phosphatidylserine decarboxylase